MSSSHGDNVTEDGSVTAVTVPTEIVLVDDNLVGTKNDDTTKKNDCKGRLESDSKACIHLTSQEETLFRVVVETAEAFARGQISLPTNDDTGGKVGRNAQKTENNHRQSSASASGYVIDTELRHDRSSSNSLDEMDISTNPPPHQRCRRKQPIIRVAGGWVRDKVLGLTTHDVDMAVDSLTGVQFAQLVHEYAAFTNRPEITAGHRIGIIACNPEQSKHLETAALKLCGLDVDLSNLRAQETYHHDSRIPTVRFGTPLEDAERRDFTINSLFFNLHSRCVEDWTQRGMKDLFHRDLVTPLEPIQTLLDDPLRVLRAIRFSVRFKFKLDSKVEAACRRSEIHQALRRKVSRERVGKELEGMLSGSFARPVEALFTIARMQLSNSVFTLPVLGVDNVTATEGHILGEVYNDQSMQTTENVYSNDSEHSTTSVPQKPGWTEAQNLLRLYPAILEVYEKAVSAFKKKQEQESCPFIFSSVVDHRLLPVAVFLLPFRTLRYQEKNKTERSYPVAQYIFQHSIKFKQADAKAMALLQDQVDNMAELIRKAARTAEGTAKFSPFSDGDENFADLPSVHISRLEFGVLLRKCKELWPSCLLLATVLLMREREQPTLSSSVKTVEGQDSTHYNWIEVSNAVWAKIISMDLDECWKMKPLLDGKAIINALKIPKGPQIGQFLEEQVRWMLQNPSGTKEDCIAHMERFKTTL